MLFIVTEHLQTFAVKYQSVSVKINTNNNNWNEKMVKLNSSLDDINKKCPYLSEQVRIDQSGGRKCSQTC